MSYPELEKLKKVQETIQKIGEFLEWYLTRRRIAGWFGILLILLAVAALPILGAVAVYLLLAPSDFWQRVVTYVLCTFLGLTILVVVFFVVGWLLQ